MAKLGEGFGIGQCGGAVVQQGAGRVVVHDQSLQGRVPQPMRGGCADPQLEHPAAVVPAPGIPLGEVRLGAVGFHPGSDDLLQRNTGPLPTAHRERGVSSLSRNHASLGEDGCLEAQHPLHGHSGRGGDGLGGFAGAHPGLDLTRGQRAVRADLAFQPAELPPQGSPQPLVDRHPVPLSAALQHWREYDVAGVLAQRDDAQLVHQRSSSPPAGIVCRTRHPAA